MTEPISGGKPKRKMIWIIAIIFICIGGYSFLRFGAVTVRRAQQTSSVSDLLILRSALYEYADLYGRFPESIDVLQNYQMPSEIYVDRLEYRAGGMKIDNVNPRQAMLIYNNGAKKVSITFMGSIEIEK